MSSELAGTEGWKLKTNFYKYVEQNGSQIEDWWENLHANYYTDV